MKWIKINLLVSVFAGFLIVHGQQRSTIVLGPIEGELAKKQIALDLEGTQKNLVPYASRAIKIHGAFRLTTSKSSKFGVSLTTVASRQVKLSIFSGKPRKIKSSAIFSGKQR